MYTKLLLSGRSSPIPTLMVTTSESDHVLPLLQSHGWARFGQQPPTFARGELVITHRHLHLRVDRTTLASGINPASPPGWWRAVDRSDGLCAVVVRPEVGLRVSETSRAEPMTMLLNADRAAFAVLPVLT